MSAPNLTKMPNEVRDELSDGIMGLVVGFMGMQDALVVKFAEIVPERGERLWMRFRAWRDEQTDRGGNNPFMKWAGGIVLAKLLG